MKIIGLILARGGSRGILNKNIKPLNGKPLIRYIIDTAKASSLDEIWVSSDSDEILKLCEDVKTIKRPTELAQDDTPSIDAVKHALPIIGDCDYVMLLNACCPLTETQDLDNVIKVAQETGCESVVSLVEDFSCHPSKVCRLDGNRVVNEHGFKTGERQKQEKYYRRNTAIYLFSLETVVRGSFFSTDTRGYVMPKSRSWDINDSQDFAIVEFLLNGK